MARPTGDRDRATEIFEEDRQRLFARTDRLFAGLMVAQWLAGIGTAYWISPRTWVGTVSHTHPHVWAAVGLGGLISSVPIFLALTRPGRSMTRYTIAVSQMLWSALLIHLGGGRIETHFHVFGSLAFLAFYRDWRILIPATVVVAADHFLRGVYWPQSVFGVLTASPWRWVEHAGWVVFEDVFLAYACIHSTNETREIARQRAQLEAVNEELQRAQVILQQRLDERDELMRVKEVFLANVSHELRTPLNVIMGYTDMLLERGDVIDERDVLSKIRNQSEHLFSLVCDLMTLAGLNSGRISLELSTVRVPDVLARLKPLVERLSEKRDLRVAWELDADCPSLDTDPLRLEQILGNLVINAFKFTPQGTITIRAFADAIRNAVTFEVIDTGIGIPAHEMPHIFDEFRQVEASANGHYGGIGLGLAMVRKLTALLQGEVSVTSAVDRGSTFTVRIPLRAVSEAADDVTPAARRRTAA